MFASALFLASALHASQALGADGGGDRLSALLKEACVSCHGGESPQAGLSLVDLDPTDLETVQDILVRVRAGEMPPAGAEVGLSLSDRGLMQQELAGLLASAPKDPGRATLRRLDKEEYGNTVRDLLRMDCDPARDLPEDASSGGFTNQGDILFVDPELAEKLSLATDRVLDQLLGDDDALARIGLGRGPADPVALGAWMQRAFRRPPSELEVQARVRLWSEAGAHAALSSVLLSPHFLFRVERDLDQVEPWEVSAWELATRLSYFLWATMPDDPLFELASSGELLEADTLMGEVERMLDDPRSLALGERFAARWLGVSGVPTQATDVRRFKGVTPGLKRSMLRETVLFFDGIVRRDESLMRLVDAEHTYLNKALADHYGIEGVASGPMQRVSLSGRRRGGVLTQASVLMATSQPLRTSPVVRGAWILDRLLASPPAPPPPDAGVLPNDDQIKDGLSQRERLLAHRKDPKCASCHARMDPLGFALENYDGVGRWRDQDHLGPIDSKASLPGGEEVAGIEGLKDALLARPRDVARGVSEALFVYALGRELGPEDAPAVEDLLAMLQREGWRARALVKFVVGSYPFRYRRRAG